MGTTTEMEIKISGRIISVEAVSKNKVKIISEVAESVIEESKQETMVLIEASKLSFHDKFMQYDPKTTEGKDFKELIISAINKGVNDFYRPVIDPSIDENEEIVYKAGSAPAVGYSYIWWENKAEKNNLRLGTRLEYIAFLGVLIKKMVESGWKVSTAWRAVYYNSNKIGHYLDSVDARYDFEPTGSRKICDFYDLGNTFKILSEDEDEDNDGYWLAGGYCCNQGSFSPIGGVYHLDNWKQKLEHSVGWLVLPT